MQTAAVVVPLATGAFSILTSAINLDPAAPSACSLSDALGPFDRFMLYVTLDTTTNPQAVPTPPNLTPVGIVRGSDGPIGFAPVGIRGYPAFAIQRIAGSAAGTLYATGGTPVHGVAIPVTTPLPAIGAFTALLPLSSFASGPIIVGLDANQTVDDVFDVYGTNDPATTGISGSTFIGTIYGGGSLTGTALLVESFTYALAIRTGAPPGLVTPGNLIAYGAAA